MGAGILYINNSKQTIKIANVRREFIPPDNEQSNIGKYLLLECSEIEKESLLI